MVSTLERMPKGPVPYIESATISAGGVVAHRPNSQKLTLPRWLTVQRQVANGSVQGGVGDKIEFQLYGDCSDQFLGEKVDARCLILDYRDARVSPA